MDRDVGRILDANFNRAREGLRVAEEFARFVAEDRRLAEQARGFRHALADAARRLDPDGCMLAARDTAGDLGTAAPPSEGGRRASAGQVATVAAKRVGEALRVLCEYAKVIDAAVAADLERLRYRFYDWEKSLAGATDRGRFARVRVYLLVTAEYCRGGDWESAVRAAIAGGVDAIQLREKNLPDGELLARARRLVSLCREAGVLSVINDRPDIARLADADGVHVGTSDLPVAAVREIVKSSQFVGTSTHNADELERAIAGGPDYVAAGPMFATAIKPEYGVSGPAYARAAIARLDAEGIPHVAIGGITLENVGELAAAGVRRVALCRGILEADDVAATVSAFSEAMSGAGDAR
ncbi:MAG: Thiamine-phosphate synthase [Phycisphaerae bacterium]|nr:Thiamine-phosphate synthase [Phycisphaerae bacterium]